MRGLVLGSAMSLASMSVGCTVVSGLTGSRPSEAKPTPPTTGGQGSSSSPSSGESQTAQGEARPGGTACSSKAAWDAELEAFARKPMKLESDIQARRAELKTLRDSGVRAVQNDCKDQEAAVREAVDAHRKTMAEQALAAGFPKQARNIFWDEYNRDDRTDKPGYKELSRKIDAAYLEEALRTFEKNGHLGDTGGATKACLFSDKPFPRDPGAQVKPIFKTHIESNRVYVMCYLPREASRYVEGESPRFVIHMGMDTGNNFLPVQTVDAGNPQMFGNSRFVHAEFELPPARSDFADVKRYAFDFLCQQKYEFDDRGVKKTRTNKIATAGLFWHR